MVLIQQRKAAMANFLLLLLICLVGTASYWKFSSPFLSNTQQHTVRQLQQVKVPDKKVETMAPTESPAPSPSPSAIPTANPTLTKKPTVKPTPGPTGSPAPSPSPSAIPSQVPTKEPSVSPSMQPTTTPFPTGEPSASPSQVPTSSPSMGPSATPTVSMQPSLRPSASPSSVPSARPSLSQMPSAAPSAAPTVSQQPSQSPTYVGTQVATFTVTLPTFTEPLTTSQQEAFVTATEQWIEVAPLDDSMGEGTLSNAQVEILDQQVVNTTSITGDNATSTAVNGTMEDALAITFQVTAAYAGSNDEFDLKAALKPRFAAHDPDWIHLLGNHDKPFLPLRAAPTQEDIPAVPAETTPLPLESGQTQMSGGALALLILVAMGAMACGIVSVSMSVETYQISERGQELRSPKGSYDSDSNIEFIDDEHINKMMIPTKTITDENAYEEDDELHHHMQQQQLNEGEYIMEYDKVVYNNGQSQQEETIYPSVRPPSILRDATRSRSSGQHQQQQQSDIEVIHKMMEREDSIGDIFRNNYRNTHIRSSSGSNGRESEQGQQQHQQKQPQQKKKPQRSDPPSAASEAQFEMDYQQRQPHASKYNDSSINGGGSRPPSSLANSKVSSNAYETYDHRSRSHQQEREYRGEAKSHNNSIISDVRSQATSLFSSICNKNSDANGAATLGARPLGHAYQSSTSIKQQPSYDDSLLQRAGLYDVFAPAGQIGIIVDTTKDGPAVHSLKSTSPMMGLINPGDLIVGLDDQDTRSMTAATLTRLMGKKSNQKERKITLLASEQY